MLGIADAPANVRIPVGIETGAAPEFSPKFNLQVMDVRMEPQW